MGIKDITTAEDRDWMRAELNAERETLDTACRTAYRYPYSESVVCGVKIGNMANELIVKALKERIKEIGLILETVSETPETNGEETEP